MENNSDTIQPTPSQVMSTPAKNTADLTFDEAIFGESTLEELESDLRSIQQLEYIVINGRLEIGNIVQNEGIYLNRSVRVFDDGDPIAELLRLGTWKQDVLRAIKRKRQHPESGIQGIHPKKEASEFDIEESEVIFVEHEQD